MKSMIDNPKVFLIQHFDDVRNQIDVECQKYLDKNKFSFKYENFYNKKNKTLFKMLQQEKMINEVDSFLKQCLAVRQIKTTLTNLKSVYNQRTRIMSLNSEKISILPYTT